MRRGGRRDGRGLLTIMLAMWLGGYLWTTGATCGSSQRVHLAGESGVCINLPHVGSDVMKLACMLVGRRWMGGVGGWISEGAEGGWWGGDVKSKSRRASRGGYEPRVHKTYLVPFIYALAKFQMMEAVKLPTA